MGIPNSPSLVLLRDDGVCSYKVVEEPEVWIPREAIGFQKNWTSPDPPRQCIAKEDEPGDKRILQGLDRTGVLKIQAYAL